MARSIVVWGGPPYLGAANSTHSEMARAFRALGLDVLYLELEGDAGPFLAARARSPGPVRGTAVAPDGVVLARIPKLPALPYALFAPSHLVNSRLAARQLKRLSALWLGGRPGAGKAGGKAGGKPPVVIHRGWFAAHLVRAFPDAVHVYDCVDDHLVSAEVEGRPRLVRRVRREERRLMEAADLTVCVSRVLAESREKLARTSASSPTAVGSVEPRCVFLRNAARPAEFEGEFAEPAALAGMPRPRALFIGRVGPKVDIELVAAAAAADPGVSWLLAGEFRGLSPDEVTRRLPPNVRALGRVPHADVPALAAHSDVGVVPLRPTPWNRASSQMKFGDMLAAGLPVVSTALPTAEEIAREVPGAVLIVNDAAGFASAVREAAALGAEARERCREWARAHTWEDRARKMLDLVDALQRRISPRRHGGHGEQQLEPRMNADGRGWDDRFLPLRRSICVHPRPSAVAFAVLRALRASVLESSVVVPARPGGER